jgi:hypothetical protein
MFDIIIDAKSNSYDKWLKLFPFCKLSTQPPQTYNYWYIGPHIAPADNFVLPKVNTYDLCWNNIFSDEEEELQIELRKQNPDGNKYIALSSGTLINDKHNDYPLVIEDGPSAKEMVRYWSKHFSNIVIKKNCGSLLYGASGSSVPDSKNFWYVKSGVFPEISFVPPKLTLEENWKLDYTSIYNDKGFYLSCHDTKGTIAEKEVAVFKTTKLDSFFLCSGEQGWEENYRKIQTFIPHTKLVKDVVGFYESHKVCSEASTTEQFWVFDADCFLLSNPCDYEPKEYDAEYVHVFHSVNPINGLEYGHGGVKVFNKQHFQTNNMVNDLTLSVGRMKVHTEVLSIHLYNTSPYSIWRTALREAYKLYNSFKNSNEEDTESWNRLHVWLQHTCNRDELTSKGALKGRSLYYSSNVNINDEDYLKQLWEQEK